MKNLCTSGRSLIVLTAVIVLTLVAMACASPAPTPTQAPAPKAEPTKPAAVATKAPEPVKAPEAAKPAQPAKPAAAAPAAPAPAKAPAAAKPTGKPIKVGNMQPLTGGLAVGGKMSLIAFELAAQDINNSGGINGSPVELVTSDSRADPKEAVTVFRKLVTQDNVVAVVGPFSSGEFNLTAALANELKVPNLSQAVTFGIAASNRPFSFQSNTQSPVWWPKGISAFKAKYPQVKKVTLVRDIRYAAAQYEGQELLPKLLKDAGLEIAGTVDYETGNKDWAVIATKIKDQNADAMVATGLYTDAPGLLKELERLGYKSKLLISPMFFNVNVLWAVPSFLEGAVMPFWVDWTQADPKVKDFVARWQAKVVADSAIPKAPAGGYNWFPNSEISNYDSLMAIADIMKKAGVNGDTPVAQAREKIQTGYQSLKDWSGLSGKITVLPSGDVTWDTPVFIIEGGVPKALK